MSSKQRKHGARWESYIRRECKALREAHLAWVRKNWEAPDVPGRPGVKREPSKPDFSGCVAGGKHVVFEAKATLSTTRFDLDRLATHQANHLDMVYRLGGIAFVYVLDGELSKWVLPWRTVLSFSEHRASVPFDEVEPCRKVSGETWLDTLERLNKISA